MPAESLTPDEVNAALGETAELDTELPDPYADEDGAVMAPARAAVGSDAKATALVDTIEACLRKHGLLTDDLAPEDGEVVEDSEVGEGFPDF